MDETTKGSSMREENEGVVLDALKIPQEEV
jgi:hypothetical protein